MELSGKGGLVVVSAVGDTGPRVVGAGASVDIVDV